MSIATVVTGGYGNSALGGTVPFVVRWGYGGGAKTGGYTPWSVYDPRGARRAEERRRRLRQERDALRRSIEVLVKGIVETPPSTPAEMPVEAPLPPVEVPKADTAAVAQRQARIRTLEIELEQITGALDAYRAEQADITEENMLLTILLMASD